MFCLVGGLFIVFSGSVVKWLWRWGSYVGTREAGVGGKDGRKRGPNARTRDVRQPGAGRAREGKVKKNSGRIAQIDSSKIKERKGSVRERALDGPVRKRPTESG